MIKIPVRDAHENNTLDTFSLWVGRPTDLCQIEDLYLNDDEDGLYTIVFTEEGQRLELLVKPDFLLAIEAGTDDEAGLFNRL